jgi:3-oxoacyl-[acyl-carrier protein] reductase
MDLGLAGRVVIVTGATSGIGRAIALRFAAEGARVVVTYRNNRTQAESVADLLCQQGVEADVGFFDLSNASTIQAVVDRAAARWGRLDVLINNAVDWISVASAWRGMFEHCPEEYWQPLLRANVEGTFIASQRVVPFMRQQRWGRIVNVSSIAAADGLPEFGWYSAAKASLHGLTQTLARELGPDGILVNVVMPGATATERLKQNLSERLLMRQAAALPIRRLPDPDDVAAPIVFLASAANAAITGEVVRASGGRA